MIKSRIKKCKDNPYTIIFNDVENIYIVSFKDVNNKLNEVEVTKAVFDVFNESELNDISYMYKEKRYIDNRSFDDSEEFENKIFSRNKNKYAFIEDEIFQKTENERLYNAINKLTGIQKRRIKYHFFDDMSFSEIARLENCDESSIRESISSGIKNIKKILQ